MKAVLLANLFSSNRDPLDPTTLWEHGLFAAPIEQLERAATFCQEWCMVHREFLFNRLGACSDHCSFLHVCTLRSHLKQNYVLSSHCNELFRCVNPEDQVTRALSDIECFRGGVLDIWKETVLERHFLSLSLSLEFPTQWGMQFAQAEPWNSGGKWVWLFSGGICVVVGRKTMEVHSLLDIKLKLSKDGEKEFEHCHA